MSLATATTYLRLVVFFGSTIIGASALVACTSGRNITGTENSISIPFDPYDFDPKALLAKAQDHCQAYGLNAEYQDETIDPHSVRWRYRHYLCV